MTEMPAGRKELMELLLRGRAPRPQTARNTAASAPLSRTQQRLWFLEQRYPGTAQNNIAVGLDLEDAPDRAELERVLTRLQELHPALRLRVAGPPDAPVQEVTASGGPLDWHDLTGLAPERAAGRAEELTAAAARLPLDLGRPPLYRAAAVLLPDGSWRLVLVFHHLVVDGWSVGVLCEDLALLLAGKEPEAPAADFVDWVSRNDDGAAPDRVREYWAARFADAPAASTLALREGAVDDPGLRGGTLPVDIDAELTEAVRALARRLRVTPYAVCLAAFKVVLRRFSDSAAVVVGSPSTGREDPALDRVVGFFVRTLALRTDIAPDDGFGEVARRVHQVVIEALDHQPMPFDELVALTGASGSESANPLFRTMLAYQGATGEEPEWNGRLRAMRDLDSGTAKFDLTLALNEDAHRITGAMEWAERGTDEIAAAGAVEAFLAVLREAVVRPETPIGEIPLTRSPARAEPVPVPAPDGSGRTGRPRHLSLADGLFRQAALTPDAVALVDGREGNLDYAALADRVARTVVQLRRRGVRPGDRVALIVERSADLVVAVHAVTAAGCGYVPIDTTAPPARIAELLAAADVALVLFHEPTRALLPDGPWQTMDAAVSRITSIPAPRRTTPARAGDCAYLLFTSGSTGAPKLVAFPTDASQAFLDWLQSRMPLAADDRVLLKTPYGFDVSVWELFWPLQHGAALVVAEPTGHSDPAYLAGLIQRERVTVANFVPSVLEYFLDLPEAGRCTSLRHLLSAGEALTPALRDRVHERLPATLINLYGPTETNAVTAHTCSRDRGAGPVPIGAALPHTRLHVLDEHLRPVPAGLRGELYIGGELGTATGYWGQPALTAERFVPDPFAAEPGRRLYRTGDAARLLPGGEYEYLGRLDRQVKLHGVRIEPAEIEAALALHPSVTSARVLVLGKDKAAELVAFYTPDQDAEPDADQDAEPGSGSDSEPGSEPTPDALRAWAAARLPRQLVPRTLLPLPRLPLNTNGKTDAHTLTAIWHAHRAAAAEHRATGPRTAAPATGADPVEREVHAAFEEVLGHPVSDRESTFFELGGNSLLLLRLAVVVERRTGFRPGIADLARRPTVALLAGLVRSRADSDDLLVPLAGATGAPTVLLLPPASGSALAYVPLARELAPEFRVLGFNAPGLGATPPRTVAEFVAGLLPSVERRAAQGPVVLAGWSFGGVLAYELGVALARRGLRPAAVAMFDSWVPAPGGEPSPADEDGIEVLRGHGLIPAELPAADLGSLTAMVAATTEAFRAFAPTGGADFPVHLIRAGRGYPGIEDAGYDDSRGWAGVVPQLRVGEVAADHFELLGPPAIHELAQQLRAISTHALPGDHPNTEGGSR